MLGVSVQKGTSRWVFLVNQKYALKIARGRLREAWYYRRWQEILEGIKANKAESRKWKASQDMEVLSYFILRSPGVSGRNAICPSAYRCRIRGAGVTIHTRRLHPIRSRTSWRFQA